MSFKEFPYIIQNKNRIPLALKFFLNKTKQRIDSKTHKKIANEIIYAAQNIGVNLQKKKNYMNTHSLKKIFLL
jgi:ribosomal protein S7